MKSLTYLFIYLVLSLFISSNYCLATQNNKVFGFIESDFTTSTAKDSSYGFELKRINLISDFEPSSTIRVLADVEYEGSADHGPGGDTKGAINLSRAYADYCISSKINFRVGKFLAPFGLYNEIHDFSASYYLIDAPRIYQKHQIFSGVSSKRFYSKAETGIQIYGRIFNNKRGGYLGYGISLSNGVDEKAANGSDENRTTALTIHTYYKPKFYGYRYGFSYHREKLVKGIGGINNDLLQTLAFEFERESSLFLIQMEAVFSQFKNPSFEHQTSGLGYLHIAYLKNDKFIPFIEIAREFYDLKDRVKSYKEAIIGFSYNISSQLFFKTEYISQSKELNLSESSDSTYKLSIDATF